MSQSDVLLDYDRDDDTVKVRSSGSAQQLLQATRGSTHASLQLLSSTPKTTIITHHHMNNIQ